MFTTHSLPWFYRPCNYYGIHPESVEPASLNEPAVSERKLTKRIQRPHIFGRSNSLQIEFQWNLVLTACFLLLDWIPPKAMVLSLSCYFTNRRDGFTPFPKENAHKWMSRLEFELGSTIRKSEPLSILYTHFILLYTYFILLESSFYLEWDFCWNFYMTLFHCDFYYLS